MSTDYKQSLAERPSFSLAIASKCSTFGTHQYFNLNDPEACCYGCGHKARQ